MRIKKDGSERTHIGPETFRRISDIRVHKYGYGLPGKNVLIMTKVFFYFVKD